MELDNPIFIQVVGDIELSDFKPISESIIWDLNRFYWQNLNLWHLNGDSFESSLPSGISEGNRVEFIEKSFDKFSFYINNLIKEKNLPDEIKVLEYGPGKGEYTRRFLELFNEKYPELKDKLKYSVYDQSAAILNDLSESLKEFQGQVIIENSLENLGKDSFLFIRHSNFWDQLSFDIYSQDESSNIKILKIKENTPVDFDQLKTDPALWRELMSNLKFEYYWAEIEPDFPVLLDELFKDNPIVSYPHGVNENLLETIELLSGELDGYLEIVDIFKENQEFNASNVLKSLDGSLFTFINQNVIKKLANSRGFKASFDTLKLANKSLTIRSNSFRSDLRHQKNIVISEIAARYEHTVKDVRNDIARKIDSGADVISFSDKAGASSALRNIDENLEINLFEDASLNFPETSFVNVMVSRRHNNDTASQLIEELKRNGVNTIFAVSGDGPQKNENGEDIFNSVDLLKVIGDSFFAGGVSHTNLSKSDEIEKLEAGAKFLIAQASFNKENFIKWENEIFTDQKLSHAYKILTLIPITNSKVLDFVYKLNDIDFPDQLYNRLSKLTDEAIYEEGISLSKELLANHYNSEKYSGVWVYTQDKKALKELADELHSIAA